jgi:hypothetical protein
MAIQASKPNNLFSKQVKENKLTHFPTLQRCMQDLMEPVRTATFLANYMKNVTDDLKIPRKLETKFNYKLVLSPMTVKNFCPNAISKNLENKLPTFRLHRTVKKITSLMKI